MNDPVVVPGGTAVISARVPIELFKRVDAFVEGSEMNRTGVLVAALEQYMAGGAALPAEPKKPKKPMVLTARNSTCLRVLAIVQFYGTATNAEIAHVAENMPGNNVAKRTAELQEMGYLKDTGGKRKTESGRLQTVWELTGKPLPE